MTDTEKNVAPKESATPAEDTQSEQVATTPKVADTPSIPEEKAELEVPEKFKKDGQVDVAGMAKSYQELEKKLTEVSQAKAEPEEQAPEMVTEPQVAPVADNPAFDEPTQKALDQHFDQMYAVRREQEKATEFLQTHQDELKDPVLAGTVERLLGDANRSKKYLAYEDALLQAKSLLDERIKPKIDQAKGEGLEQGQNIVRKKIEAGTIGEAATPPSNDDSVLTAAEFAKKYNIPKV